MLLGHAENLGACGNGFSRLNVEAARNDGAPDSAKPCDCGGDSASAEGIRVQLSDYRQGSGLKPVKDDSAAGQNSLWRQRAICGNKPLVLLNLFAGWVLVSAVHGLLEPADSVSEALAEFR